MVHKTKTKKHSKEAHLGRIFDLGVQEGDAILIWGYAEGYNFDFGVRKYQKVENPCINQLKTVSVIPLNEFLLTFDFVVSSVHRVPRFDPVNRPETSEDSNEVLEGDRFIDGQ